MYRSARAQVTNNRLAFLAMPRQHALAKPKLRLTMRNGCSPLARIFDSFRFFKRSAIDAWLALAWVKSLALGAKPRITSVRPA